MKKILNPIITIFLISIFSLTACGGGAGSQPPSQDSNAGADQAQEAPAQASAGDPAAGQELFAGTCAACHGPEGKGVPNLGKDMTASEFIANNSDDELIAFIKVGRDPSHPLNTTGVAMPPKGGNPALSDDDLQDIVAFVRTLQQ